MAIELVPLATATATLAAPLMLPNTPVGTRVIFEIVEFCWEGPRFTARQKGAAAADWLAVGPEGTGTLDVWFTNTYNKSRKPKSCLLPWFLQHNAIPGNVGDTITGTSLNGNPGITGTTDGVGTAARFSAPQGITLYCGSLYIGDTSNGSIRRIK